MVNNFIKIGLTERGRLQTQFAFAKVLYRFHKPRKTHYRGQTKTLFLIKFKKTNKYILKAMLVVLEVVNFILLQHMKMWGNKKHARSNRNGSN